MNKSLNWCWRGIKPCHTPHSPRHTLSKTHCYYTKGNRRNPPPPYRARHEVLSPSYYNNTTTTEVSPTTEGRVKKFILHKTHQMQDRAWMPQGMTESLRKPHQWEHWTLEVLKTVLQMRTTGNDPIPNSPNKQMLNTSYSNSWKPEIKILEEKSFFLTTEVPLTATVQL